MTSQKRENETFRHGAEEPSIVDLESGKLLTVLWTSTGNRLQISLPRRRENVDEAGLDRTCAAAWPPLLKRLPGSNDLMLVWNYTYAPWHPGFQNGHGPRNPLLSAISTDEGETWHNIKTIENRNPGVSSTPAVTFFGDKTLPTYDTQLYKLSRRQLYPIRLKIIPIDWFRNE